MSLKAWPGPRTGVPVVTDIANADIANADTLPGDGVKGWIPNAVDIQADRPTRYSAPYPHGRPDEWLDGDAATARGMDPRYLTPEDQDRLHARLLLDHQPALTGDQADCATYLRAAIALAKASVAASNDSDDARRWALVRTKTEEALLYALFGDRVV